MERRVGSSVVMQVERPSRLAMLVSAADVPGLEVQESFSATVDGVEVAYEEIRGQHGTRIHVVDSPTGELTISYEATVTGTGQPPAEDPLDLITYLRPSRYAESDRLAVVARSEFSGLAGTELLTAVATWVGERLLYVSGASRVVDSAVDTLLAGQGVCRDFTHLLIALLRARDVPARMVAAYAPGLSPMDFHAVAEAYVDGAWLAADATRLAPRSSLLRIATGQDAADTAFLSAYGGGLRLVDLSVTATVDGDLPVDDQQELLSLR